MSMNRFRGATEWALMVTMVLGTGALAQAQEEQSNEGGPVIQIGRADTDHANPQLPAPGDSTHTDGVPTDQPAAPKYWIGLLGAPIGPDHPLRAHIDLPEKQGLLVDTVVPESPAAKAGIQANDILLRANDTDLTAMTDLVDLVRTEGEKQGQIAIEVLRHGSRETVYVTPAERPADAPQPGTFGRAFQPGFGVPGNVEIPQELFEEFREAPLEFRNFGPGVIVGGGGGMGVGNLPDGVSVSVSKQGDQPSQITVKRGEETWTVVGDDPKSLEQLPEDLRPFVAQMVENGQPGIGHGHMLPQFDEGRLRDRLERMERRMQELQERMIERNAADQNAEHHNTSETK